jgi:hypothetical protein
LQRSRVSCEGAGFAEEGQGCGWLLRPEVGAPRGRGREPKRLRAEALGVPAEGGEHEWRERQAVLRHSFLGEGGVAAGDLFDGAEGKRLGLVFHRRISLDGHLLIRLLYTSC